MKNALLGLLAFGSLSASAGTGSPSMECASVAAKAALTVFTVSAKEDPRELQFISATVKAEELIEEPSGRFAELQYRVDVTYKNKRGDEGSFYYRVETRKKKGQCFIEAIAYNHDD